jgi:hypothetical protein
MCAISTQTAVRMDFCAVFVPRRASMGIFKVMSELGFLNVPPELFKVSECCQVVLSMGEGLSSFKGDLLSLSVSIPPSPYIDESDMLGKEGVLPIEIIELVSVSEGIKCELFQLFLAMGRGFDALEMGLLNDENVSMGDDIPLVEVQ